jgi:RNA polymerase sigma factor (sigma-70 family)
MKQGDEMAYRIFYQAYHPRLWRYLLVVTAGNEDAAADALQGALVRVVRYIKPFPDDATFWGWLTVLARAALSDQMRGRRRYLAFLDRFTRHAQTQPVVPEQPEADSRLLALLETQLSSMAPDEKSLIEAKYFEGRSVLEIAQALGTSEKAVESRLVRVRRKLKSALLNRLKNG